MDLATIVRRYQGKKNTTHTDEKYCCALAELLNADPSLDAAAIRNEFLATWKYVPGRAVRLAECAAKYLQSRPPLNITLLTDEARKHYQDEAQRFRQRLSESPIMKDVIIKAWLNNLDSAIQAWDVREPFRVPDHMLFMAYIDDKTVYEREPDFIATLDAGISRLRHITKTSFNDKLRNLARDRQDFISTAFEPLILTAFADRIIDYEPTISGGVPEARIRLGGRHVLIEARAKMEQQRGGGMFNPEHMGHKLAGKAREKYAAQLAGATEPVILFMALDAHVVQDLEPEAMLAEILQDPASRVVSAIVFGDTYRAKNLKLWLHPQAIHPLACVMIADLKTLLDIQALRSSGRYLPRASNARRAIVAAADELFRLVRRIRTVLGH